MKREQGWLDFIKTVSIVTIITLVGMGCGGGGGGGGAEEPPPIAVDLDAEENPPISIGSGAGYTKLTYDTPGYVRDVSVAGGYAYVADGDFGLRVINISDPEHPVFAGDVDTPDWARAVSVVGGYAYVANGVFGLQVIDISDLETR